MKILHTPNRFLPDMGGVERYVADLATEHASRGHEVVVFACSNEHQSYRDKNVYVKFFPYVFSIANTRISFLYIWRLIFEDFDVLHAHLPTPWTADFSVFIAWLRRKKVVLTYHNHIVGDGFAGIIAFLYRSIFLRILFVFCDKIIVTTERYKNEPVFNLFRKKVSVIPCFLQSLPEKCQKQDRDQLVFGFMSVLDGFHGYKNLIGLLDAFSQIDVDFMLKIAGKGQKKDYFEQYAKKTGIAQSVEFLGFVPDSDLDDFYCSLDYFVLPSVDGSREGFGIVALEALSCGVPVIVSDIVGVARDVEDAMAGFVCKAGNESSLHTVIKDAVSLSREQQATYSVHARKLAENFLVFDVGADIMKLYEK